MAVALGSSGSAIDLTNSSPYTAGTVVSISAVPNQGYVFANWTAPAGTLGSATTANTTFTMPAQNVTVTANFVLSPPAQHNLTISSTAGGSVTTPGEGVFTYDEGVVVNLVAEAGEGYWFVEWTGDVSTVADVYSAVTNITMNGDYQITANFAGMYGNYSDLLEHVITSQGEIDLAPYTEVNPSTGNHSPQANYGGGWPTAEELCDWYGEDVEGLTPYPSDTIDLAGVNKNLGPIYREGTLTIKNSSNTPATLTLTGTIYITGDTLIGTTGKDFTLDLNGYTIFAASNSSDPKKALWMGGKCTLVGEGAVIAVGDMYFEPRTETGMTNPVFVMSVCGTSIFQVGGDFYGSIAGSVVVALQPGTSLNYPDAEGWYSGINFPGCTL